MTLSTAFRGIAALTALAAAAIEAFVAWHGHMLDWLILPSAVATFGTVVWAALAFDALGRRAARPDRSDIVELLATQRDDHTSLTTVQSRVDLIERRVRFIAARSSLVPIDAAMAAAAADVERWDAVISTTAIWYDHLDRWSVVVRSCGDDLAPEDAATNEEEARRARLRLPYGRNFSSQDLKTALRYLVLSERLAAARARFAEHATAILGETPETPAE